MTDEERKTLVERLRGMKSVRYTHVLEATAQIVADGEIIASQRERTIELLERIAELEAENERLRYHLDGALDTLQDAEVCSEDCVSCAEARAALGETK